MVLRERIEQAEEPLALIVKARERARVVGEARLGADLTPALRERIVPRGDPRGQLAGVGQPRGEVVLQARTCAVVPHVRENARTGVLAGGDVLRVLPRAHPGGAAEHQRQRGRSGSHEEAATPGLPGGQSRQQRVHRRKPVDWSGRQTAQDNGVQPRRRSG
ncbi:hypothetical protein [Nannocystis pusilla]|uniref:hypothetical protein n=1 Tax=Nannocystis pusilla TaxID=889268 RepID=UPI003B768D5C